MKKKILALVLALTMCFGTTITANAAMNISNEMGALNTHNILDKNSSKIPKGTLQYMASKFKIEYTQEDLKALKKIFDANLYAKAYPDVAAAYGNDREALWNHYVTHGINEGRTQINSGFNVFAYISAYPDLRNAFGDDLVAYYVHYANNGINENRKLITVDAATRAGITVTGLQGQVIARPAPIQVPDLSAYSVPGGVLDTDQVKETPEATTQPTETPKPSDVPSPSVTPTPTPIPEEPSEPSAPCEHTYDKYEYAGDGRHYMKCSKCNEFKLDEKTNDESAEPCEFNGNELCVKCNTECKHQWVEGACSVCQIQHKEHTWENGQCTICQVKHENHEYDSSTGKCLCGDSCLHSQTKAIHVNAEVHKIVCDNCNYTMLEQEKHKFSQEGSVPTCKCGYVQMKQASTE